MKLREYVGLYGQWPPPACDRAGNPAQLDHCLDTLVLASHGSSNKPKSERIRILTAHENVLYVREIFNLEEIFARILCDFLNEHCDETIRCIGEIDIIFLS